MATDGEVQVPDVILINTIYNESTVTSTIQPKQHIPTWTTNASFLGDQNHRNTSKSEGAECMCPLMSLEPTDRFLSMATDYLTSQSVTGHTGKESSTLLSCKPGRVSYS